MGSRIPRSRFFPTMAAWRGRCCFERAWESSSGLHCLLLQIFPQSLPTRIFTHSVIILCKYCKYCKHCKYCLLLKIFTRSLGTRIFTHSVIMLCKYSFKEFLCTCVCQHYSCLVNMLIYYCSNLLDSL